MCDLKLSINSNISPDGFFSRSDSKHFAIDSFVEFSRKIKSSFPFLQNEYAPATLHLKCVVSFSIWGLFNDHKRILFAVNWNADSSKLKIKKGSFVSKLIMVSVSISYFKLYFFKIWYNFR